jgi:hypothetical protein
MLIEMLKLNLNNGKKENSKIYFCGNDSVYKIGQTKQKYISDRMKTIRKIDANIKCYVYIEFEGTKAVRDLVESVLRLYLENNGYKLQGNDHFKKKGTIQKFKKLVLEIVTTTLNELEIDYKVVNKG